MGRQWVEVKRVVRLIAGTICWLEGRNLEAFNPELLDIIFSNLKTCFVGID